MIKCTGNHNRIWDKYIDLCFIERCSLFGVSSIGGSTVYKRVF